MSLLKLVKPLFACIGIILLMLVMTSLFDIVLVLFYSRFYSNVLFIVTFGAGGVFAGVLAYMNTVKMVPERIETARWILAMIIIVFGFVVFFLISKVEGGEYGPAFKAFGITMALAGLLMAKGKFDL